MPEKYCDVVKTPSSHMSLHLNVNEPRQSNGDDRWILEVNLCNNTASIPLSNFLKMIFKDKYFNKIMLYCYFFIVCNRSKVYLLTKVGTLFYKNLTFLIILFLPKRPLAGLNEMK